MKTILLTGATSGIGYEASVALAREGHRVVMVGRDAEKTARCVAEVKARSGSTAVESLLADFTSLASVRALAAAFLERYDRLDVLVNNAGTVYSARTVTGDGFEATWAVNHLAGFLLTELLRERLLQSAPSRVVWVSSTGHYRGTMDLSDVGFERGGYFIMKAYARSKLANVLMARGLAKQLEGRGVTVNALHPGVVGTRIWDGAPGWVRPLLAPLRAFFMLTPEEGAKTITWLATGPEGEGQTGLYFEKNRPRTPSALARDDGLVEQVWRLSASQVGL